MTYVGICRRFLPDLEGQHRVLEFMSSLRKASDNLDLYTTLASISGNGPELFSKFTHGNSFSFDLMHHIRSHPFYYAHFEELGLSAENGTGTEFSFRFYT
jgi:hypothetical protein